MTDLNLLPWAIHPSGSCGGGGDLSPPDPTDPGAHRPPPHREWGWFLLAAALVGTLVYAAVYSRLHP